MFLTTEFPNHDLKLIELMGMSGLMGATGMDAPSSSFNFLDVLKSTAYPYKLIPVLLGAGFAIWLSSLATSKIFISASLGAWI